MKKNVIEPGQKFGHWTVQEESGRKGCSGEVLYRCRCDCGRERLVGVQNLISGRSQSCGQCGYTGIRRVLQGKPCPGSKSGVRGVHWNAKSQRWEAEITIQKERRYLGQFEKLEDAIAARFAAENELRTTMQGGNLAT
ncbi:AP2 domain-containing protein [Faecalibaculum rodentium]|uniref:AP2 domain-containing protein n=1 Tax=Faecalibaculum rodentium TaxID=1702221 RepID=UPI00266FF388|nr:AP2 domain-containing protein [Faecalibaculum rodentium]